MKKHTLLFFLATSLLVAAPAFQGKRTYTQADGTTFSAKAQGDEYLNWIETDDGDILRYNTLTKNYEYAQIADGGLQKSGQVYHKRNASDTTTFKSKSRIPSINRDALNSLWKARREARHQKYHHHH